MYKSNLPSNSISWCHAISHCRINSTYSGRATLRQQTRYVRPLQLNIGVQRHIQKALVSRHYSQPLIVDKVWILCSCTIEEPCDFYNNTVRSNSRAVYYDGDYRKTVIVSHVNWVNNKAAPTSFPGWLDKLRISKLLGLSFYIHWCRNIHWVIKSS